MTRFTRQRIKTSALCCGLIVIVLLLPVACVRPGTGLSNPPQAGASDTTSIPSVDGDSSNESSDELAPIAGSLTDIPDYVGVPTPDPIHNNITEEQGEFIVHVVAAGETLGILAQRYGTTVEELIALNDLANPDIIQVGQSITVPGTGEPPLIGPDFKIIPDSELVYGPAAADFDVRRLAELTNSHLLRYEEEVEGQLMDGPAIVQLVADRHSVNPRLLLALLEYLTGWVTTATEPATLDKFGPVSSGQAKLYQRLSWAANLLNLGYYGRAEGGLRSIAIDPTTPIYFSPTINHATAGIQVLFASLPGMTYDRWQADVGPDGLFAAFNRLFGNPFGYTVDPLIPDQLVSPEFSLPWTAGETWYFTGGPHGAWNTGSAWGALDFAPPSDQLGCVQSDFWVTAIADGVVTRSGHGAVVVDLNDDTDNYAGTGWAITYMHIETRDRAPAGTEVKTGDRLGHPSCEGGFSNGTHVHIARSYNGRWISADTTTPFILSGWVSEGAGTEYNGYLVRDGVQKEACACRDEANAISFE